ncbi:MAG TPA: ATP-binding protein, partial [Oculatellaceae cyanobacterium]
QSKATRRFTITETSGIWLNHITRRWSIHKKIACGYVLAISIAILGTSAGLIVGEHFDDKATQKLRSAEERHELMDLLEQAVIDVKIYQQQIMVTPENTARQQDKLRKLLDSINEAKGHLSQLKSKLKDDRSLSGEDIAQSNPLLQTCNIEMELYTELVESLLKQIDANKAAPGEIQKTRQVLWTTIERDLVPKFEKLSESLEQLANSTKAKQNKAQATFKAAKVLRAIIIIASMVLSMAIALALAFYTSRAIARPLQSVTNVAKQVTQEGNFNLQATVTTDDEVGVLATSLNQLIQRVALQIRELQQAQAQLIQSEKMSSLGQMVAGIAHEINNPVNFRYGNLNYTQEYTQNLLELVQLYQQHYPAPVQDISNKIEDIDLDFISEDLPKTISSMQSGTERIREIILSLRKFSHLDEAEMKKVDIHEGIDNTLLILRHRLTPGIAVIKQYDSLPLIECYPAQLNQVFMNILINAIDELLTAKKIVQPQIVIQTKVIDYNQIEVRIQDNGSGIDLKIKDKIFDPFFTTKPVGKGTGMGLAICYQIVEKHHGKIEVISEVNQGAEFVVTLPRECSLPSN